MSTVHPVRFTVDICKAMFAAFELMDLCLVLPKSCPTINIRLFISSLFQLIHTLTDLSFAK